MYFRWKGIEDQTIKSPTYWTKVFHFHSAPAVKMCYHFVSYRLPLSYSIKYVDTFVGDLYMVSTRV